MALPDGIDEGVLFRLASSLNWLTADVLSEPEVAHRLPRKPVRARFAHTVGSVTSLRCRSNGPRAPGETPRSPCEAGSSAATASRQVLDRAAAAICATA